MGPAIAILPGAGYIEHSVNWSRWIRLVNGDEDEYCQTEDSSDMGSDTEARLVEHSIVRLDEYNDVVEEVRIDDSVLEIVGNIDLIIEAGKQGLSNPESNRYTVLPTWDLEEPGNCSYSRENKGDVKGRIMWFYEETPLVFGSSYRFDEEKIEVLNDDSASDNNIGICLDFNIKDENAFKVERRGEDATSGRDKDLNTTELLKSLGIETVGIFSNAEIELQSF